MIEHTGDEVHRVSLGYFDTIGVASTISILKTGQLFIGSELGNHMFYNFIGMGENEKYINYSNSEIDN